MMKRIASVAVSVVLVLGIVAFVLPSSTPAALTAAFSALAIPTLIVAVACLTGGVLLSALRLKYIAADIGFSLSLRDATATLSVGQLAGNLFFQFAGQMIGRTAMLARRGVPAAASVMISGYERIFALFMSLTLAVGGALYLFGRFTFDLQGGGLDLIKLMLGLTAATAAGAAYAWGPTALALLRQLTPAIGWRMLRSAAISMAIQLTTLGAYVVTARTLAPHVDYGPIIAASCLIMFASSLPISLGGWGLRELSAVVALKAIGMSSAAALVVGLVIGALSLSVVALAAAVLVVGKSPTPAPRTAAGLDYGLLLDWVIPIASATAVFFQIYIPVGSGQLNVNLADPMVMIGACLFGLRQIGHGWPAWRVPSFHAMLLAASAVIGLSFLHGLTVFGMTDWAFTSRLIGWPLLLCYGATGALIVRRAGDAGLEILLRSFAAAGAALAVLDVGIVILAELAGHPHSVFGDRVAGFSQNPNAFAFILLMALAAALTLRASDRGRTAVLAAIFAGLWFAGSRAGFIAIPVVLIAALYAGIALRPVAIAALWASTVPLVLAAMHNLGPGFSFDGLTNAIALLGQPQTGSDRQHIETVVDGLRMFIAHPLFGAGLGAYMANQIKTTGVPLVIHSTPVWLLAETGLAGLAVFVISGWKIFSQALQNRTTMAGTLIVLTIVAFATMAEVHELLYQRALWLLLGAALVLPIALPDDAKTPDKA
ncbi:MAG: hypothetical protein GC182_02870 [Rhodopseudomonas sp.]|nr:hypothetical protein [Rhodopseudomonas sp.]